MTQTASIILNELEISKELKEKIEFIKFSKMNFKDFNDFKILINSLENFEPNSKLSQETRKKQINEKIVHILEKLDNFIKIINDNKENSNLEQDLNSKENLDAKENLNEKENLNNETNSNKERFTKFLLKLDEFDTNEEAGLNEEEYQILLKEINELLTKDLSESENEFLKKIKEEVTRYGTIFKENLNEDSFKKNESLNENPKDLPLSYYEEVKTKIIEEPIENDELLKSFAKTDRAEFELDFNELSMHEAINAATDLNNNNDDKFYEKYFNDADFKNKFNKEMFLRFVSFAEKTNFHRR